MEQIMQRIANGFDSMGPADMIMTVVFCGIVAAVVVCVISALLDN